MIAPPLAVGTLAIGLTLIAFIIGMAVIGMVRARGDKNRTFLEWDPVDRTGFLRELDDADVHTMLDEHNQRRAERGLAPQTLDEYIEQRRRD